ncbi:cation:proton antiporter [bacterium]|nr:cation:proton antiporter [bacterium]
MKNKIIVLTLLLILLALIYLLFPQVNIFLTLGLLILISYFLGQIFDAIHLPMVSAYLFVGIILGPQVLKLFTIEVAKDLQFIDMIALTIIALIVGKELSLKLLKGKIKTIILATLIIIGITFLLQGVTVFFSFRIFSSKFNISNNNILLVSLLFGFLALAKSPLTTIALMKETNSYTSTSILILTIIVLKDIIVLILFSLFIGFFTYSRGISIIFNISWKIFGSFIIGGMLSLIVLWYLKKIKKNSNLMLLFLAFLIAIISEKLHIETLLTAITVGFIVENFSPYGDKFLRSVEDLSVIVFIVFFSVRGMNLDLNLLNSMLIIGIAYTVSRTIYNYIALIITSKTLKLSKNLYKYGWSGFINQSGVTIAIAILIEKYFPEIKIISPIALSMVIITDILAPPIFKLYLFKLKKIEKV